MPSEASERVGALLKDKYRLDSVLGVGGMAIVYAATHRNRKRFAVKILRAELSIRAEIRGRLVREGYIANTVGHAGAVAILDDDVASDLYRRFDVPHYWIVDPSTETLTVHRLLPDGYLIALRAGRESTVRAEPFEAIELRVGTLFGDE